MAGRVVLVVSEAWCCLVLGTLFVGRIMVVSGDGRGLVLIPFVIRGVVVVVILRVTSIILIPNTLEVNVVVREALPLLVGRNIFLFFLLRFITVCVVDDGAVTVNLDWSRDRRGERGLSAGGAREP